MPSLRHGRQLVAIPGPSVIPDRVLATMHQAMPNIYEGDLVDTSMTLFRDLPQIARTGGEAFVTISNGHGAWEMALTNTLCRGDRILVLESGRFARGWGNGGAPAGLEVQTLAGDDRGPVDPDSVETQNGYSALAQAAEKHFLDLARALLEGLVSEPIEARARHVAPERRG